MQAQTSPFVDSAAITGIAAGPYASRSFLASGITTLATETAESFAIHQAVKWAMTATEPVVINFYCKAYGHAAEATYAPTALSRNIVRATRGLLQRSENTGARISFAHTKGHAGNVFNEIAGDYAKAGADCLICNQTPFTRASEWYSTDSPIAEWAWLLSLTSAQKHVLGPPGSAGNFLSFPPPLLPDAASLEQMITPVTPDPVAHGRHIEANFVSFNIGAIADRPFTQGITAFGGKVAMLSAQFSKA